MCPRTPHGRRDCPKGRPSTAETSVLPGWERHFAKTQKTLLSIPGNTKKPPLQAPRCARRPRRPPKRTQGHRNGGQRAPKTPVLAREREARFKDNNCDSNGAHTNTQKQRNARKYTDAKTKKERREKGEDAIETGRRREERGRRREERGERGEKREERRGKREERGERRQKREERRDKKEERRERREDRRQKREERREKTEERRRKKREERREMREERRDKREERKEKRDERRETREERREKG